MVNYYKQIAFIIGVLTMFVSDSSSNDFTKDFHSSDQINLLPETMDFFHLSSFCQSFNRSFCISNETQPNIYFSNYINTLATSVTNSSQSFNYGDNQCKIKHFLEIILTKTHEKFQFLQYLYELIMRPELLFETPFKFEPFDCKHEKIAIIVFNQIIYFGFYLIFIVCRHCWT